MCKFALSVNWLNKRNSASCKNLAVVFAKAWRCMDNSSSVFSRNKVSVKNTESSVCAVFLYRKICKVREKRFVFCAQEIFAFTSVDYRVAFFIFVVSRKACLRHDVVVT